MDDWQTIELVIESILEKARKLPCESTDGDCEDYEVDKQCRRCRTLLYLQDAQNAARG